jgi:hypothetical protein
MFSFSMCTASATTIHVNPSCVRITHCGQRRRRVREWGRNRITVVQHAGPSVRIGNAASRNMIVTDSPATAVELATTLREALGLPCAQ